VILRGTRLVKHCYPPQNPGTSLVAVIHELTRAFAVDVTDRSDYEHFDLRDQQGNFLRFYLYTLSTEVLQNHCPDQGYLETYDLDKTISEIKNNG
jgi:hypothetical protein